MEEMRRHTGSLLLAMRLTQESLVSQQHSLGVGQDMWSLLSSFSCRWQDTGGTHPASLLAVA